MTSKNWKVRLNFLRFDLEMQVGRRNKGEVHCGNTFTKGPLQQVVLRLQFGDEIAALQKLAEFLWRIERLITRRPQASATQRPSLRQRSAITKPGGAGGRGLGGKGRTEGPFF